MPSFHPRTPVRRPGWNPFARPSPGRVSLGLLELEDRSVPATLVVSLASDKVADDDLLSLREAVEAVNRGDTTGLDDGARAQISGPFGTDDTIVFDTGGVFANAQTITLEGVQLRSPGT